MSEEIQSDVAESYMEIRKNIEGTINRKLANSSLSTTFIEWAFIAIVRHQDHPDYQEIKRKHTKRKVLEFRLKIDHQDFLVGSEVRRIGLIIDALRRCVTHMADFGIIAEDQHKLFAILEETEKELKQS
ncbi:Imm44 family immunity protein [Noviherbaspirillum massiliense]|uniref:Imm44 family immunity protein n=1 Tax=Noviherbaspirillum massiliense TaxID=1465823 RepID=UPI0013762E9D|nr:Imm44 family immunity protein [Noviherbaspirillum massiliense]